MTDCIESATYILPIRANGTDGLRELADYLRTIAAYMRVIVIDGSPDDVFANNSLAFGPEIDHRPPDRAVIGLNGKVRNVLSGLAVCVTDKVVVADDDVRYDLPALAAVVEALDGADVVRPQNYFSPLPWHAYADSSRILINRALDGDWPGTLGIRRSSLPRGYDADALFENLELVRTIRQGGGRESVRRDIYVRRLPPTTSHYLGQRIRQAYDEFARPVRLTAALAVAPCVALAIFQGRWPLPVSIGALSIGLATVGYVRDGGHRYFPWLAVALAPLWILERAVCAWLAVYERLRYGGVRYAGGIIRKAASTRKELQQRWAA